MQSGGEIYTESLSAGTVNKLSIINSILWGNTPDQLVASDVSVSYSDVQGGFKSKHNIDQDPLLESLADNDGFTKTQALRLGSPAIDAAVGLGLHPNFEIAIAAMTRTSESFEPNLSNHKVYDELYQRVCLRMYNQLKPLYEEIWDITGYPPKF